MVNYRLERGSKLLGRKLTYGNPDSPHHSGLLMDAGFEDVAGELALRADMILQAQADGSVPETHRLPSRAGCLRLRETGSRRS